MNKCDLAVEFLNKLNALIKSLNEDKTPIGNKLDKIKDKIELIKDQLKDSELKLKEKQISINQIEEPKQQIIYKHKKNKIYQISSPNVKINNVKWHECTFTPCKDVINQLPIFEYKETRYVNSKEELNDLKSSKYFLVDSFYYDQRTYNSFLCYLSILDINGILFIIDILKFREDLIEFGFLTCKYKKIFVSPRAYYACMNDFRSLNCYIICDFNHGTSISLDNLSIRTTKEDNMIVDWRIRPIDMYMKFLLQVKIIQIISVWNKFIEGQNISLSENLKNYNQFSFSKMLNKSSDEYLQLFLQKILNKVTEIIKSKEDNKSVDFESIISGNTIELINSTFKISGEDRFIIKTDEDLLLLRSFQKDWYGLITKYICYKHNIKTSTYLEKLIRHREHIAMDSNNSIYLIATDKLITQIYKHKPTTFDSFKDQLKDANPLLKSNFHGFLYLEELKEIKKKKSNFKPVKINKNKDIRGNPLDEKDYLRRKRQYNVPKFTYKEDSSDLEWVDNPIKKDKFYRQKRKNKSVQIKVDTMLKNMDIKEKNKKKRKKTLSNINISEKKIEKVTSEPTEVTKKKKRRKRKSKKNVK